MKSLLTGLAIALCISLFGKEGDDTVIVRREYTTSRANAVVKIDGALDEAAWQGIAVADNFEQNNPVEHGIVRNQTEVKIIYDNVGIYVGAMMYDSAPDSIGKQLGIRDDYELVADQIRIVFDTYNTQQDAFDFTVTASGVQLDNRFSDFNYNAVWKSATNIVSNGWVCEMLIPWSALRFPTGNNDWGLQITRSFSRNQEFDQWALTPKDVNNSMKYWGVLKGLNDVESPVRLSLTPYFSTIYQDDDRFGASEPEFSIAGGMDLKWGINESFTVDMTLLPDFSQVQSDNVIKNLGAFEQTFGEQRPFFTEGVDLFQRGNLFYSRRIGATPSGFYDASYSVDSNEVVTKNPSRAKLLNATKISGRTNLGMGLGILNAYIDNTYATVEDTLTGKTRKLLTEPRSNYNIFVIDKQLANSSNVYFINTNVLRTGNNRSSNVTGVGSSINNKANTYAVDLEGAVSNVLSPTDPGGASVFTSELGYKYFVGMRKTSGEWQAGISRNVSSKLWDANDLGITFENNFASNSCYISHQLFNPKWIFNYASSDLNLNYNYNLRTGKTTYLGINLFNYFSFRNFSNYYIGMEIVPKDFYDYFEPRVDGRVFLRTRMQNVFMGYGSNYSKKFSMGFELYAGRTAVVSPTIPSNPWIGGSVRFTWRASDRLKLQYIPGLHVDDGDRGWVNIEEDGTIVFGRRIIRNLEQSFTASYVFMKDMTISISARHYWATGHYYGFYVLQEDGTMNDYVTYNQNHDFSFNTVNADIVYRWIFAPGSILSVSYKLNTMTEEDNIVYDYKYNFKTTMQAPQLNQVSVRVLYYLDYQYITAALSRK